MLLQVVCSSAVLIVSNVAIYSLISKTAAFYAHLFTSIAKLKKKNFFFCLNFTNSNHPVFALFKFCCIKCCSYCAVLIYSLFLGTDFSEASSVSIIV